MSSKPPRRRHRIKWVIPSLLGLYKSYRSLIRFIDIFRQYLFPRALDLLNDSLDEDKHVLDRDKHGTNEATIDTVSGLIGG